MRKYFISILTVLCIVLVAQPSAALAVDVLFQPDMVSLPKLGSYTVTLLIDTQGESINAVEGTLAIASGSGDNISATDSGSIITYWINRPEWNAQQRTVEFRGAVPGGFSGKGILFSMVMPAIEKSSQDKPFIVSNFKALRNDGLGSQARVSIGSFTYGQHDAQVEGAFEEQLYIDGKKTDNIPPEVFSPQISRDERVLNSKWFISFATQDKQSGIDHYEIQETRSGHINAKNWKRAESPYQLEDQELHSYVYVIAIDRQGNERVIRVYPRNPLPWYNRSGQIIFMVLGVIIIAGAAGLLYRKKRRKNHLQTV